MLTSHDKGNSQVSAPQSILYDSASGFSFHLLHSCGITLNPSMAGWRLFQHGKPNRSLDCDNFKTFPVEALKQYSTLFFFKQSTSIYFSLTAID